MNLQAILTESAPNALSLHSTNSGLATPVHSPPMPKHVVFALLTDTSEPTPKDAKGLPTVNFTINAHDTTESIASTVKSFFGLFSNDTNVASAYRVSFENEHGSRMILSYDNVEEKQMVFVRAMAEPILGMRDGRGTSPHKPRVGGASMSRSRSRRHDSRTPSPDIDLKKLEQLASADISVENILEGSRRKRPKFESSELPLFPEMANRFGPASSSSASPSRPTPQLTPYSQPGHQTIYPPPQSAYLYSLGTEPTPPPSATTATGRVGLPTPAPTIASCISDEDAAIQLMRLGEKPTNNGNHHPHHMRHEYSPDVDYHGQPTPHSALLPSPVSHGYSQHASPVKTYGRPLDYGQVDDDLRDGNYVASDDYQDDDDEDVPLFHKRPQQFAPSRQAPPPPIGAMKKKLTPKPKKIKKQTNNLIPAPQLNAFPGYPAVMDTSFNGLEAATSLANLANPDGKYIQQGVMMPPEPQENQKPRCQRCRKSKKGCDRQRPCQRCKDAGIPADQCISEDEAGTRRGRMNAAKAAAANGIVKPKIPKVKKRKISISEEM
ncbi:hypothetical protein H072_1268 [Dactylellina haptotyla CBS 200.50]|uniref:Zn(2)-C6 fungal-type domain-containing protein n=1 Tax=Dactylellina haptotyla (strain CBS 200.50) TaxID=1284197 RepID=S8AP45_DACHA|nr:hypothetical protein H072_1268 [Dactylellina haptotyla CBS 200.50]